ncbi:cardiolipin synthase [Serpentinicella alkaliphila]|uniref:Cardiolipin synthase n=1 Tax=Serpentinicella alkaliphila TaxID=1734049 RepID=A0A4R2U110_9FIRM|nr:cardiolipin synthase [Serpentinicella alkaliphila]QUH24710.1 cardiolipin synthase [Serpentinicella alkaliphila]TCQ03699.1 cardiolipin synthase [Serpentinicella alkaliphila]
MIQVFIILTFIVFLVVFFFNLFNVIPQIVFIGFYPYALFITVFLGILLFSASYIQSRFWLITIKAMISIVLVISLFTLILIVINARHLNGYKKKYSEYIRTVNEFTKVEGVDKFYKEDFNRSIATLIEKSTGMSPTFKNNGILISDNEHYFDEIIEAISKAEKHVHVLFYIMRDDNIGQKLKTVLIDRAKQGVEVRVIYDALGSFKLSRKYINELKEVGVEIVPYNTVFKSLVTGKLNHRTHRKMIIVDGVVAFTGGVNIGDEYLNRDKNIGIWQDIIVEMEGDSVNYLQKIFLADWYYVTDKKITDIYYYGKTSVENYLPVQMVAGGFDTGWHEIHQMYFTLINSARGRLYIATPYFVLNDAMLESLQTAALRGVDVKIVIPEKTESFLIDWLNESFFKEILRSGVEVYKYKNGFMHAKSMIVDNRVVSVGSANLNMRGYYLDYEMNVLLYDEQLCLRMEQIFNKYMKMSEKQKYKDYEKLSLMRSVRYIIGRLILPIS